MKIINQETVLTPVAALRPHPRNPRQGDVGAIHESIAANGFYGSVVAQRSTGFVLAGNHRLHAAIQAGAPQLPVTWVDVDDATALRIMLADNRTNDVAGYDTAALAELLKEITADAGTLEGTGYDGDALDDLLAGLNPTGMGKLKIVDVQPLPTLTWVLIGIPTVRFGEIAVDVERIAALPETQVHLTANNDESGQKDR